MVDLKHRPRKGPLFSGTSTCVLRLKLLAGLEKQDSQKIPCWWAGILYNLLDNIDERWIPIKSVLSSGATQVVYYIPKWRHKIWLTKES